MSLAQEAKLPTLVQRRQRRLIKRREEAMPLFTAAGIADEVQPIPTMREIEREYRHTQAGCYARVLRMRLVSLRHWLVLRRLAEQYLTMDQIQRLEETARIYPDEPSYRVGHWASVLAALGLWKRVLDARPELRVQTHATYAGATMDLRTGQWDYYRSGGLMKD